MRARLASLLGWGLGFRSSDGGLRVWGFRALGLRGLWVRVQGLGWFRV